MDYGHAPLPLAIHLERFDKAIASDSKESEINPLARFFEDRAVAHIGGADAPTTLQKISAASAWNARLEERSSFWFQRPEGLAKADEWDSPLADDGANILHKRISISTRHATVERFIRSRLALGETVENLAKHARQHDEATAVLIEKIGMEIAP